MARQSTKKQKSSNGANLGFEATLWAAADKLRGHMDAAEYKHVVLGLIFLKYISDAFEERHKALQTELSDPEERMVHRRAAGTLPDAGGSGRVPVGQCLLGAKGSPMVNPAGKREAAHDREADR